MVKDKFPRPSLTGSPCRSEITRVRQPIGYFHIKRPVKRCVHEGKRRIHREEETLIANLKDHNLDLADRN